MANLDPAVNFGLVEVSIGYAAGATSIVLSAGDGAKLPDPSGDGEFNLVWWDSSTFGNPSDDTAVEVVRCTARTTDTLTVTRAQEGTSDVNHNTGGITYKMALGYTAKVRDDINTELTAKATKELDNLGTTAINTDLLPDGDNTRDLGSASARFAETHSKQVQAIENSSGTVSLGTNAVMVFGELVENTSGTATMTVSAKGAFASGYLEATGATGTAVMTASAKGAFAFGAIVSPQSNFDGFIRATGPGTFALGYALPSGADAYIDASGWGAMAMGYAGWNASMSVAAQINATSYGSFAGGWVGDSSGTGTLNKIEAAGGAFAFGLPFSYAGGNCQVLATGYASFAVGYAYSSGSGASYVRATGVASFAHGRSNVTSTVTKGITASGAGSFAQGYASNANILASQPGALARGNAVTNDITASASGAHAFGASSTGAITASATNAFQFGVGVNAITGSLQVASAVSLRPAGQVFMKEVSAATTDVAGWGQLWVKTATPNQLWFTDDAGTDTQIV